MAQIVNNKFNHPFPSQADVVDNTPYGALIRGKGRVVTKELSLDGTGAQTDNVFTVTGSVEIIDIYGVLTDATDVTTLSGASFTAYDGTNTVDITESTTGVDLSGATVNSLIIKNNTNANAAVLNDSSQVRVNDTVTNEIFAPFIITAKNGATTYIRFNFTGDADTDAVMKIYLSFIELSDDGNVEAV